MRRIPDRVFALAGAATIAVAVMAGLLTLYPLAPARTSWQLDYHDSLSRFSDIARLARCAWIVSGDITPSRDAAVAIIGANEALAQETGCDWYDMADEYLDGAISWERLGPASLKLCGEIHRNRSHANPMRPPRARDYTFPEIGDTEVSEGPRCYSIDIASAPADAYGQLPLR